MAAIVEARCHLCNRPWRLRRQPCPVYEGDDPIEHEFMVPVSAIAAALDRVAQGATMIPTEDVRQELLGGEA